MAKIKKELNTKLYAVIAFFLVLAFLVSVSAVTFKSKYNAFHPDKVAVAFTESIVNRGDGYNSYKNTLISKNYKYGDYIREYYMYPVIYLEDNYQPGMDIDSLENGLNSESKMGEKTKNDDGSLAGQVIDEMYPYYEQLMTELNGWDNYNTFFTKYFAKLVEVRKDVFGDDYMTDEIMFTALESNVSTYGDKLVGTEDVIDEKTSVQTSVKTIGIYEKKYGENCVFTYEAINTKDIEDIEEYKESLDAATLKTYKVSVDDIKEAKTVTVQVKANGTTVIEAFEVNVVKIGSLWYVDNTNTNTTQLYSFYK